uniref:Uncharacterized protein n=1 Tax=Vespula pensylvanica TaxID=30213 RepID=A0A834NS32_VESPE|nr:hypothetical protein H0235_011462 [Vespula pensylvanica]
MDSGFFSGIGSSPRTGQLKSYDKANEQSSRYLSLSGLILTDRMAVLGLLSASFTAPCGYGCWEATTFVFGDSEVRIKYILASGLRSNVKASIHPDLWRDKEQRTFFSKNVIRRYMSSDNRSGEMDFREFSMGYRLWVEKEMRRRLASGRRDGRRENGGVKEEGLGDWRKSSRDSYKISATRLKSGGGGGGGGDGGGGGGDGGSGQRTIGRMAREVGTSEYVIQVCVDGDASGDDGGDDVDDGGAAGGCGMWPRGDGYM